jgi:hypothetical protein
MRTIRVTALMLIAIAGVTLLGTSIGEARDYPWCAQYGGRSGARNCGFDTFKQCLATISGIGGFCERNPLYGYFDERRPRYWYRDRD